MQAPRAAARLHSADAVRDPRGQARRRRGHRARPHGELAHQLPRHPARGGARTDRRRSARRELAPRADGPLAVRAGRVRHDAPRHRRPVRRGPQPQRRQLRRRDLPVLPRAPRAAARPGPRDVRAGHRLAARAGPPVADHLGARQQPPRAPVLRSDGWARRPPRTIDGIGVPGRRAGLRLGPALRRTARQGRFTYELPQANCLAAPLARQFSRIAVPVQLDASTCRPVVDELTRGSAFVAKEQSVRPCGGSNQGELSDDAPVALIVVDSLTIRMELAAAFEAAGFTARLCATAAEARAAWTAPASVAILDAVLPDGDGADLLREIRANPATARLPALVLSSTAPYDPRQLVARASKLVDERDEHDHPTVLVIEDSPTFLEVVRRALE